MKISKDGLELIKRFEGCRLTAYKDPVGIWTIGYGHTGSDVHSGKTISAEQAEALLKWDIATIESPLQAVVPKEITQPMTDALFSLAYNIGVNAFAQSTACQRIQAGDYTGAALAMMWWNKGTIEGRKVTLAGLLRRRAAEVELFLRALPHQP